jgi:holliday junction DNA helicase RuvA
LPVRTRSVFAEDQRGSNPMIYQITGQIISQSEDYAILETHGIGYQVFCPRSTMDDFPKTGNDPLTLYTYHAIREDSETLYGFLSAEDREFFMTLTSVSGVGPKVGLKILSALTPPLVIEAILKEDTTALVKAPGVGKKMAERLVLELKDKLAKTFTTTFQTDTGTTIAKPIIKAEDDIFLAMRTLGYSNDEIKRAYLKAAMIMNDETSTEDGVKLLLKHL